MQRLKFETRRLKALVAALIAVLAVSAMVSATVSAEKIPAPSLLTLPAGSAITGTGESGAGTLTTLNGTKITCEKAKASGSVAANAKLGPFTQDIEGCKEPATGLKCTGLGEATGVILVSGESHLAVDVNSPTLGAAILLLVNTVHFSCFVLIEVTGQELCLAKPVNTFAKHFESVCEETAAGSGDPKETKYWDDNGELAETGHGLLVSINHGTAVGAARNATALGLSNVEVSIMV